MQALVAWALAIVALIVGYRVQGWQGVILAVTIIGFWLALQFSKAMRVMRVAAQRPVGSVPSAVMLHAKLHRGMKMLEVITVTRSLGREQSPKSEVFAWHDDTGASVQATFVGGRLASWTLQRSTDKGALEATPKA